MTKRSWFSLFDIVLLSVNILRCFLRASASPVTLQWRRLPTRRLLALFAFPHTVTLQGRMKSRKVSHYRTV